ncbi:hypothetical protein VA596_45460 [Amycolatopsis sp., V23-08]|uniref:Recombinase A n=1 Tax=Amycolatopsis heterodermiae TaxID=3110235 RepID=A0ABU5RKM3_9PSEU|nr:hypothetical protein [Amycolatopsis sp., V23-08]MEA5366848.1 hypothetical protein [Amycolatopsis sp., V23-08]
MAIPEALTSIPGVRTASELNPDVTHSGESLPVAPALAGLFPAGGLRRGTTVSVTGSTSLVLALLAEATKAGSWAAVTGLPDLGLAAAAELGVDLDRIALVPRPGAEVVAVLSALVDGFDLVVLGPVLARGVRPQVARRLAGRVRNRGAVLLTVGSWPGAELEIRVTGRRWRGAGLDGYGHLQAREIVATSQGRGAAVRPQAVVVQLPGLGGAVVAGEPRSGRRLVEVAG